MGLFAMLFGRRSSVPQQDVYAGKKTLLRDMLADERFTWRKLSSLARAIGENDRTTADLAYAVGARRSRDGQPLFTIKA